MRPSDLTIPVAYLCLVLAAAWVAGCTQSDLGRYCVVGAPDTDDPAATTQEKLNTQAPECAERLCVLQRGYRCADGAERCDDAESQQELKAVCTQPCAQSADCASGDENVNGCHRYVCKAPDWGTDFDRCYCTCLDFIRDDRGDPLSADAFEATDAACGG